LGYGMRKARNFARDTWYNVADVQTAKTGRALVRNSPIARMVPLRRDAKSGGEARNDIRMGSRER
jgi:hypothetical protein